MADAIEDDVAVNGTRLHIRIDGAADRPWLVLVNALATDLALWQRQVPAFAPHYRVLRYDGRGHGRSAAPPGPYSIELLVDDLAQLIAHCGAARAHVVGLSLGGVIAAAAALRQPDYLASVTIADSRLEVPAGAEAVIDERNRLVRAQGTAAVVEPFIERWFTPATLAAAPAMLADVRRMIAATSVEGFIGCAEALKAARILDRLGAIRVPALFLVGDHDAAVPVEIMRGQQRRVPGARHADIAAAGHLANLERPDAFNAAVLAFLGAVESLSSGAPPLP